VKSELLPSRRLIAVTAFVATIASLFSALGQPAALSVDGQRILSDVPPVTTVAGKAYVPIRAVAEGLGGSAAYDAKSGAVVVVRGHDVLRLNVGSTHAKLNGNTMTLKRPPFVVRGRAMVGLSVVKRAFGSVVAYNGRNLTIDVTTPGVFDADAQDVR
jgi:trimeric autotransporter adhesin